MATVDAELSYRQWHFSAREDDASICTDHGYCIAVKPRFYSVEEWRPVAEAIIEAHNSALKRG
jgi:hypothetical protein